MFFRKTSTENEKQNLAVMPEAKPEAKISRVLPSVTVLDDESRKLAEEVAQTFGYSLLLNPLGRALRGLEIEVLNASEVKAYMEEVSLFAGKPGVEWAWIPLDQQSADTYGITAKPYAKPIPEFVLRKALQIRKAVPEVAIFVREFEYVEDPFLWVGIKGGHSYYVEVWDEPKFEERMIKGE